MYFPLCSCSTIWKTYLERKSKYCTFLCHWKLIILIFSCGWKEINLPALWYLEINIMSSPSSLSKLNVLFTQNSLFNFSTKNLALTIYVTLHWTCSNLSIFCLKLQSSQIHAVLQVKFNQSRMEWNLLF